MEKQILCQGNRKIIQKKILTLQPILEAIKNDIEKLVQKQTEISKKLEQIAREEAPKKTDSFLLGAGSEKILSEEKKEKYQNISKMILKNLQALLKEKEQVTVQELVYAMPDDYSLADIYQTLDIMKGNKQIEWAGRELNPKSYLEISR